MKTETYGDIRLNTSDKISRQGRLHLDTDIVLKDVGIDYSWKVTRVRDKIGRPTSSIKSAEFKCTFILSKEDKNTFDDFVQKNEKKELTIEFLLHKEDVREDVKVDVFILNGLLYIRNMYINGAPVL